MSVEDTSSREIYVINDKILNSKGCQICGHMNNNGIPCRRVGRCPFHYLMMKKLRMTNNFVSTLRESASKDFSIIEINSNKKKKKKRAWKKDEHLRFLEGLKTFGKGHWKEITRLVGTRTASQVHSHSQKYFLRLNQKKKKNRTMLDLSMEELRNEVEIEEYRERERCKIQPQYYPLLQKPLEICQPIQCDYSTNQVTNRSSTNRYEGNITNFHQDEIKYRYTPTPVAPFLHGKKGGSMYSLPGFEPPYVRETELQSQNTANNENNSNLTSIATGKQNPKYILPLCPPIVFSDEFGDNIQEHLETINVTSPNHNDQSLFLPNTTRPNYGPPQVRDIPKIAIEEFLRNQITRESPVGHRESPIVHSDRIQRITTPPTPSFPYPLLEDSNHSQFYQDRFNMNNMQVFDNLWNFPVEEPEDLSVVGFKRGRGVSTSLVDFDEVTSHSIMKKRKLE